MNVSGLLGRFDLVYQGELLLRIVVAAVMGYLMGYERKNREKGAGMRTHSIVCMGAALIMIVSKYSFRDIPDYDASRVAAQIVSGVGFLGAGVIFIRNNAVSGLTTAAGIWATAGVGMAIGAGSYFIGISSGVLVVVIQMILHTASFLTAEPYRGFLKITTSDYEAVISELRQIFRREHIREVNVKITKNKSKDETKVEFDLLYPAKYEKNQLVYNLAKDGRIHGVSG